MSRLANALVKLTGARDRASLHDKLVTLLVAHYDPNSMRLLQLSGKEWNVLWSRGRHSTINIDAHTLTLRHEALVRGQPLHLGRAPWISLLPLGDTEVLELEHRNAGDMESHALAEQLLRVHRNVLGLLDYSERDSLTGLFNRRSFVDVFERLIRPRPQHADADADTQLIDRRHGSSGEPCWLAVIDIDHFKLVNDVHGHLVGDDVLVAMAGLMNDEFRHNDRLYRFGGEEFVALMTCSDAGGMYTALERLRRRIEAYQFPDVGRVTISAGFTCVQFDDTPTSAFERADRAVYTAKSGGRNRVVRFEQMGALDALPPMPPGAGNLLMVAGTSQEANERRDSLALKHG